MMITDVRRQSVAALALMAGGLVLGTLAAVSPLMAAAVIALTAVLALTFLFPVAHLMTLLLVTAIVPFSIQNTYAFGGGVGATGLVLSDLLLFAGLARAGLVLGRRPITRGEAFAIAATVLFLVLVGVQFLHGVRAGNGLSGAGAEMRVLLGFSTVLIALPLLDDARTAPRVLRGLVVAGILLGLAGLAQWVLDLGFTATSDFGVREGVAQTSAGRGQVIGGYYAFPVAVVLSFAALSSGQLRSWRERLPVVAVLSLNGISLLLTFERTFWIVSVLGCLFVALLSGRVQRARALVVAPLAIMVALVPLAALAPQTLITARERLLSVGQYQSDDSVRYRLLETSHVSDAIRAQPLGAGLGDTIWWGRPYERVLPEPNPYAHNGYLWLAWKLGVPAAILASALLAVAIFRVGRTRGSPLFAAVALGARGALLALAVASVTFPAFNSPIPATMGVLLAFCALPRAPRDEEAPKRFGSSADALREGGRVPPEPTAR